MRLPQALLLASVFASVGNAATVLSLNPVNGALSGHAGQEVGWGFTIQDSEFWVVVASTGFCTSFSIFIPCSNPVPDGSYSDFTQFNFILSQPSSLGGPDTSQQNFNAAGHLGVGSFSIGQLPIGTLLSGVIEVDYNLFDGDPNVGGTQIGGDFFITANASVLVTPTAVSTPEPGTLLLMGTALTAFGVAVKARHWPGPRIRGRQRPCLPLHPSFRTEES